MNEYFTVLFGDLVASILQEHSLQAMSGMILNNLGKMQTKTKKE